MRVLITGTNGFIGGHVCAWFRQKGWEVIGLDLHETSRIPCDGYICCNLGTPAATEILAQLEEGFLDAVVHLAADMRHEPYTEDVVGTNCTATQRLLECCEAKKVPAFVQLSSLPVIGSPVQHPIREDHPVQPPTVYHCTKYMQELLANYAFYTFGLRTVSFRICSPVGTGVNPKTIFPTFVRKAMNNEEICLYGKGTRKQTYIHVRDIAQAIEKAIMSQAQGTYNLASHNLLSNYELAQKCVACTGSSSRIMFAEKPDPLDDLVWDISIDKAKTDMGYEPLISIEEAIVELADAFRQEDAKKAVDAK